jgi:tetratricopeptide (TPR) repeat protein
MLWMPWIFALSPPILDDTARREALAHYGMGIWFANRNQLASAARELEQAQRRDGDSLAVARELVRIYAELGRDDAALRIGRDIVKRSPSDFETARVIARLERDVHRHAEALAILKQALASNPLAKKPADRLRLLRECGLAATAAADHVSALEAWTAMAKHIEQDLDRIRARNYDPMELHRERAFAFEKQAHAAIQLGNAERAMTAASTMQAILADTTRGNDPLGVPRALWLKTLAFEARRDFPAAIESLTAYIKYQPTDIEPYSKLASLYDSNGQSNRALTVLEKLSTQYPNSVAIRLVLTSEIARTDFAAAHQSFIKIINESAEQSQIDFMVNIYAKSNQPKLMLRLAESLFPVEADARKPALTTTPEASDRQRYLTRSLENQPQLALGMVRSAADGHPRSAALWELLAWLATRNDAPADVESALKKAIALRSDDDATTPIFQLLQHYQDRREWQKCLSFMNTLQSRRITISLALTKSRALAELGRMEDAIAALDDAGGTAAFYLRRQRADLYGIAGQYSDKLAHIDRMLLEFKDDREIHSLRILRADAFLGLDRIDDMEAELRGLLEHDPDDALVLNNLGYNLADRNRKLPEAERLIRRAIEINTRARAKRGDAFKTSGVYLDSLGWVLLRQGQLPEARSALDAATRLPDGRVDAVVWDHLGDVCYRQGDKAAAKRAWATAHDLFADDHRGKQIGRRDEVRRKLKMLD